MITILLKGVLPVIKSSRGVINDYDENALNVRLWKNLLILKDWNKKGPSKYVYSLYYILHFIW